MRKTKLMVLSLFLVMLQIVSLLAIIPASAAAKRYAIYKTDTSPVLDGVADSANEAWDNVPWSETFKKVAGDTPTSGFSAKFKMMWSEDAETGMTTLWYYIYVEDETSTGYTTTNWTNDYFALAIASGGTKIYSNGRVEIGLLPAWEDREGNAEYNDESTKNETSTSYKGVDVDLGWQDHRKDDGYYTIEYMVSVPSQKISNKQIAFDVMVNDHTNKTTGNNEYSRNAWDMMNNTDFYKLSDNPATYWSPKGIGVLSNVPAFAADDITHNPYNITTKEYTFYKVDTAPTKDTDWNDFEWSENFYKTGGTDNSAFAANFKGMWVDNTDTIDLWLYVLVKDADATQKTEGASGWTDDYITTSIDANRDGDDDDTGEIDSNFRAELENIGTDGKITYYNRNITFTLIDERASEGYYTVTMCIPIAKTLVSDNQFHFDLMANNCASSTSDVFTRIAWNGMNNTGYVGKGIGYLSDEYASHADEPITTEAGAGTRLNAPAGLRFESRVNKAKYDAAVAAGATITTGTLIIPTEYLTYYGINNSNFTKANLDALEINYLDVVNNGWAATTDDYYMYYGSIVDIKTANLDRAFSGIGYMTVKTDDGEYTVYGGYRAADHSRSVQYVASAAIASGEYNAYLDVLKGFIKDSAPAKAEKTTYRVMQYNLMRDGEGWGGNVLEVPYLASSVRKNIISAAVAGYAPDIFVVNERFSDTWADLGLSKEYKAVDDTNINSIVYNTNVFDGGVVASGKQMFADPEGENQRNVCYAILKDGEQLVAVFATHWSTDSSKHAAQLASVQAYMSEVLVGDYANIPVVIAGDFTSLKNGENYTALLGETYTDAVTSATSVDHIAVKGFTVVGQGMETRSYTKFASDHKPIYADIKIGG